MLTLGVIFHVLWLVLLVLEITNKDFRFLGTPAIISGTLMIIFKAIGGVDVGVLLIPLMTIIWCIIIYKGIPKRDYNDFKKLLKEKPVKWFFTSHYINFKEYIASKPWKRWITITFEDEEKEKKVK